MTGELERQLRALGATLELPPPPDAVPAVLARLPRRRGRWARPTRRALVIALAAAAVACRRCDGGGRPRVTRSCACWVRGVKIERITRLPSPSPDAGARLGLGAAISLGRARHAASFTAFLPPSATAVYLGHDVPGGRISLLIGKVLIIEFRGATTPFIFKFVGPGTTVQRVRVNGGPGLYFSGALHEVLFQQQVGSAPQTDRIRLAGNVLIWQQGSVTLRIEGTRTLAQALAVARSLR